MTGWWIIAALCWIACGVATYGFQVAHYQRKYTLVAPFNRRSDRIFAALAALSGPAGLLATLVTQQYRKGWML